MPTLSAESIAATQHVMDLARPSALVPHQKYLRLDLSDPLQHRFFMDRFGVIEGHPLGPHFPSRAELARYMAQPEVAKAPQAHPPLHARSASPSCFTEIAPLTLISAFDYDNSGVANSTVTAAGIVSVPGGTILTDVMMEIYDGINTAGTLIATGAGTSYGDYDTVANATGTLTTAGDSATALFSGNYVDNGGEPQPFAVVQTISPQPLVTITVGDPIHKVTTAGTPITVALGRYPVGGGPQDTDYYYNPGHPGNDELIIAVTGSAVPVSPSFTFVTGQTVNGSLVLQKKSGASPGGGTAPYPGAVSSACTVTALSAGWSFAPADFGVNPPPWSAGDVILLTLNLTLAMNGPRGATTATVAVTGDQSGTLVNSQIGNTYFIDPLQFYWGCLAGHARVRLAEGGDKVIRDIKIGEQLAGPGGALWTVRMVKTGKETKPMLEIVTASGDAVVVTDGHPILTADGPRTARSLGIGDRILTWRGQATVAEIHPVAYDGAIFNLVLANADGSLAEEAAFYADGILVGDDRMQTSVETAAVTGAARAEREALARSMSGWALDIENHRRARLGLPLVLACVDVV